MATNLSLSTPSIGDKPHEQVTFRFPQPEFGRNENGRGTLIRGRGRKIIATKPPNMVNYSDGPVLPYKFLYVRVCPSVKRAWGHNRRSVFYGDMGRFRRSFFYGIWDGLLKV